MNTRQRLAFMGAVVTVRAVLRVHEADSLGGWAGPYVRTWKSVACSPRAGWVVGFTHRRNGVTSFRGDEGPTFKPTACVPCMLVTFWPTHAPVEVPLDGFDFGGIPDNRTASWQDERVKNILREEAKTAPRKNGKFCKV